MGDRNMALLTEMKVELAFAAGMSMSFDRSVQHDFILTYATFDSQPQINLQSEEQSRVKLSLLVHLASGCIATSAHSGLMFDEFVLRQSLERRQHAQQANDWHLGLRPRLSSSFGRAGFCR